MTTLRDARPDSGLHELGTGSLDAGFDATEPDGGLGDGDSHDAEGSDVSTPDAAATDAGRDPSDFDPATGTLMSSRGIARAERLSDDGEIRAYRLSTTAPLRDGAPVSRELTESVGAPRLRTGHLWLDAVFAMAIGELEESRVESVHDGAFANGGPVACSCFEAGERWPWAWTRDVSYSAHLSLGWLDPARAARTQLFEISDRKSGVALGGPEILQDTGTGGSWPVSSDRVVWALGARATLEALPAAEAATFRARVFLALSTTAERDRRFLLDARDGLYRGESSFLDWREQTYPSWVAEDPRVIAGSKSLSTNVLHFIALSESAKLADELGDAATATRHRGWAAALGTAIRGELRSATGYSAGKGDDFDPSQYPRRDLLGESLLVLSGLVAGPEAAGLVASYPRGPFGPPVVWPESKEVPIYHNRATWPFVTAYGGLAARSVGNDAAFDHALGSLMLASALHLSHVENLELMSGAWYLDDGPRSGPVVSSRRQLWSVAGFLGLVIRGLFGLELSPAGVSISPFVSGKARRELFGSVDSVELRDVPYGEKRLRVRLLFPREAGEGPYSVTAIRVDGAPASSSISNGQLSLRSVIEIQLGPGMAAPSGISTLSPSVTDAELYAPREPRVSSFELGGGRVTLGLDANGEAGVTFEIQRDGATVAMGLSGDSWTDPEVIDPSRVRCYSVRSARGSLRSHSSTPACAWSPSSETIREVFAGSFVANGGVLSSSHGELHYDDWGDPEDTLEAVLTPVRSGRHLVQARYGNGSGAVSTGLTAAVKWVTVFDGLAVLGEGPIVMPQLGTWERFADSTTVSVELTAGRPVRVRITDAENMSYFERSALYGGPGGGPGPFNRANISAIRLLAVGSN